MDTSYWSKTAGFRMGRRRALALMGGTAAGAALLAACGSSSGSSSGAGQAKVSGLISESVDTSRQAKRGGVSKHFLISDLNGFDPHVPQAPLRFASDQVIGRLVIAKAGHLADPSGDMDPYMAESWEWSPDLLQLTFKLRQGAVWHNKAPINGRAFDPDDVIASWNRFATRSQNAPLLANSANPGAPVLSVNATDSHTVVFKLKEPIVYLLGVLGAPSLGNLLLVPKETDSTFDIRKDMIGTGPFVMQEFQNSVGMTLKRFDKYYDKTLPYIDTVEAPIISEYALGLAELKAGNLYTFNVRAEDIVSAKGDTPSLNLYEGPQSSAGQMIQFGWYPQGKSPFLDERVRQAFSMSFDRDLFIDTLNNVSKFKSQGLAAEVRWNSPLSAAYPGWLDPRDKSFGANGKYYQHDLAGAKQLLAAAGYPDGVETTVTYIGGPNYGVDYQKQLEILVSFSEEAGFKTKRNVVDYVTAFPKYRDVQGRFEGWTSKASGGSLVADAVSEMQQWYLPSKSGGSFIGYDAGGKGDQTGDPFVTSQLAKARGEVDTEKRLALVQDLQRYMAKAMYGLYWPGTASSFLVAWPVLANFNVYRGDTRNPAPPTGVNYTCWIDDTKAPLKKA